MGEKHMRIPWVATLEALIEELNRHLDEPKADVLARKALETDPSRPVLGVLPELQHDDEAHQESPDDRIASTIRLLLAARDELESVNVSELAASEDPHFYQFAFGSLDKLDERSVRYPEQAGREGMARFTESGGLIGPILGQHVADVLRGDPRHPGAREAARPGQGSAVSVGL